MQGRLVIVAAIAILNIAEALRLERHDEHPEFSDAASRSLIERDVMGEVRWHF